MESCPQRNLFGEIRYLALVCEEETMACRLRERPTWRGCDEEFIQRRTEYLRTLNAGTTSPVPIPLLDTTHASFAETAERIRDWATRFPLTE
ncbi:MAG: hypothetical protein NT023_12450 [Armatimonadetes bacterium]|nr:hypothetical protein [Armatimonadota bacterium]